MHFFVSGFFFCLTTYLLYYKITIYPQRGFFAIVFLISAREMRGLFATCGNVDSGRAK